MGCSVVGTCALLVAVAISMATAQDYDSMIGGMEIMSKAHDAVCWYAYMKTFPNTDPNKFLQCKGGVRGQMGNIKMNEKYFKKHPDQIEGAFSGFVKGGPLNNLPNQYKKNCMSHLTNSKSKPPADESDAMNDGGKDYPWRGYSYCLIKTTRDTYGDRAIEDIKNERTRGQKDWHKTMLDNENQARTRHGVKPLAISKDLANKAQSYAEQLAKECDMHHSGIPGENLATGNAKKDEFDIGAYLSTNMWYNEMRDMNLNDMGNQELNHFTQTVWKSSEKVGYGMAINPDCKKQGRGELYVAARYDPPGNEGGGAAKTNVFPAKD